MSDAINLQEAILREVRRDKIPVTLFLMNGFQLRGTVTGYDSFVVVHRPPCPSPTPGVHSNSCPLSQCCH